MAFLYKYNINIYGYCVRIYMYAYFYICTLHVFIKLLKKEKGGGKPQEEWKAVLSEEENEEEIAIITLKDLKLQFRVLMSYHPQSTGVILEQWQTKFLC